MQPNARINAYDILNGYSDKSNGLNRAHRLRLIRFRVKLMCNCSYCTNVCQMTISNTNRSICPLWIIVSAIFWSRVGIAVDRNWKWTVTVYTQFSAITVTFITRSVVSTSGNTVKRARVNERLNEIHKRFKFSKKQFHLSLTEDIARMAEFLSEFYDNKSLKNKRINLIIDRRHSTMHSNECECYAHCTDFDNEDAIIKMNVTPTIPRLKPKEQSNPNLFHINFFNFCDSQILAYFIRKESCMRFFPELMMDVWPKIFFGDPKSLLDIVYKHKFRHSFAVGLNDKDFTQNYYALFNRKFISINYYRPRIDLQHKNQRSARVGIAANDDIVPQIHRAKNQEFNASKSIMSRPMPIHRAEARAKKWYRERYCGFWLIFSE